MSVLKSKRKPSEFEVFNNLTKLRKNMTELLLRNFGYDFEKATRRVEKKFGGRTIDQLSPHEQEVYAKIQEKNRAFDGWFIKDERAAITNCMRNIVEEVYVANNIYPTCAEEFIERRIHQDRAIGQCYRLVQELQYAIETLPVDVDKYLPYAEIIYKEITLLKGWRKADNKFKRAFSDTSSTGFAFVNLNGNANNNNASNSNGVRPDFDTSI